MLLRFYGKEIQALSIQPTTPYICSHIICCIDQYVTCNKPGLVAVAVGLHAVAVPMSLCSCSVAAGSGETLPTSDAASQTDPAQNLMLQIGYSFQNST